MNRRIYWIAGILSLGFVAAGSAANAQTNEPWCGADHSASVTECVYPTLQRCEEFMHSQGGYCLPNPSGRSLPSR
ncbi:MAG TPA: DUF3551 domain-containing protein [Xanthobacteraceae bacterium]|jgi:hypothetical protein